jgi:hypothetical protein
VTCYKIVPVQDAGDEVVVSDQHQVTNCSDHISRSAVALTAATSGQTHLTVDTARPMDDEHYLRRLRIDIGHHLLNNGTNDAFFEAGIGCRSRPDCSEVRCQ